MKINTSFRNIFLAIMTSYGGLLWLNAWHQYHEHGIFGALPFFNWARDLVIVVGPVLLAVWIADGLSRWLSERLKWKSSNFSQSVIMVFILSVLAATVLVSIEANNHFFRTGIGRGLSLLVSICITNNYIAGIPFFAGLFNNLSDFMITRNYLILQDWLGLLMVNLGISSLVMLALKELETQVKSVSPIISDKTPAHAAATHVKIVPVGIIAFSVAITYGSFFWLNTVHAINSYTWMRDGSVMLPFIGLAVIIALRSARLLIERLGQNISKSLKGAVIAVLVALFSSLVLGIGSTALNIWLGIHTHFGDVELSPAAHWGYDALFTLMPNIVLAGLVYIAMRGKLWAEQVVEPVRWRFPQENFVRQLTAVSTALIMIPSLLGINNLNSVSAAGTGPCPVDAPVKNFNVSAIDVTIWLNRFGDHDPDAHMYVLDSMIPAVRAQEAAGPSSLSIGLRDDPIQPLAIRANMGDCVVINFTNNASAAIGSTNSSYGMHIDGLAFQTDSSGDAIGNNPSSAVAPGDTVTYTYWIPNDPTLEGAHYIHPGPGNRQAVAHGLFGTLNVEPPGSVYRNPTTGLPQLSGWEADIIPGNGRAAFRENVQVYHEIGNESESTPVDINGASLPVIDPHTKAYRPGSRAINYRSESFMNRLDHAPDHKSVVYGSYTFGDTTNVSPRGYQGDPTKIRLVHGGSEVFHVFHLHGGAVRWRFNPLADVSYDYGDTGLNKWPVNIQSESARLDSQSMGPGEAFNLEIENGAGGGQLGAGEFLFHCHIAHHYFSGMWGYWRVFDTLQPDLLPLPDRAPMPVAVDSAGLIGRTINGQTITAENLDAWIRPQLPPQGVTKDINVATRDTADQDASVWDWTVDPSSGLYLGEPDRNYTVADGPLVNQPWPNYANVVPGHPSALIVDQQVSANGTDFNSGGYIGDRPKILFNPVNGRPAFPLLRPHIGKRPPFSPNGHSGAPYLGESGNVAPNPVIPFGSTSTQPIDPWANRSDAICPVGARLQTFNIVGIGVPIQITRAGQIDQNGALFALAENKDDIYAHMDLRELLAIRGNIGDCLAVTYVSELTDGGNEVPYSKANIHIHHVQFDTQGSDGVVSGFSYEQSIRPYKIVDPQLTAGVNSGDTVLQLSSVAKFQPGVWIAVGMGTDGIEIRQIISINSGASTVTLNAPLANAHPANEWAGTEFVQYRWYPDVELDNVFFHDHVNGIFGWSHGMVGQLVIEPVGSTYHDPVTGEEIRSGAIADIHTSNPLIPGVIDGSFREFVLWTINDHNPVEATLNLRAEPWADRSLDPRLRFSSNSPQGDPFTPIFRAYAGDPVVIRNINVGQASNVLHIDGHSTYWEPRFTDALGVSSSPIDAFHSSVSEKYTLILNGGAGGPNHVPGDYIYHDGENRRFQSGAWGILRVLPAVVGDLQPLPSAGSIPAQTATCPPGAPVHNFNISAVDLPSTDAGGGRHGRNAAFVASTDVAAVLNKTKFPEPLVLHVAAGECVNVTLTNQRALDRASFHLGGLLRDMNSSGINIGYNPEQTIAPGQSRTYTYYAYTHKLESVLISDFGGDNSGWDGLYGAMVVAPAGATFKNSNGFPTDKGSMVNVYVPGEAPYRDFTLIMADQDPVIGQDTMPYPADISGPALINYRQVLNRPDDANMFSSLVHGDPTTPLLRAYAGDPVKIHVLGAPGSEQMHVFNLGGMSWPGDMYIPNSSQWQSRAVGPWEKIDIKVSGGAGGPAKMTGDYFYGDLRRPFTQAGMWGIFRVLPNTCPTSAVPGVPCLVQAPPTVTGISPNSGPITGGTVVTVTGTNFNTTSTSIKFGANAATNVSCSSSSTCTAMSPAGSGIADVTVTVAGQTSAVNNNDKFTYVLPPPSVTAITPNSGYAKGGTVTQITGENFSTVPGGTTIMFGENSATNVACSSSTACSATSPAGSIGVVDVIVTANGQSSGTGTSNKFTYLDSPPEVLSITRVNSSPTTLGTVWFLVSFSEPVTGVDQTDFNLTNTGSITGTSVVLVNGSGTTRSVSVNTGTGSGTVRLDLVDNDSITDTASNSLSGSEVANGNFSTGQVYSVRIGNFQKLSPANASTNVSINPTLSWNTSSSATSYEYCIDTTAGSTCDSPAGWVSTGTTLNVALSGLSPNTTYYWQVRSVLAGGNAFANNAWWSFTTSAPVMPGTFGKTSPTNGIGGRATTQALSWSASSNATSYEYCIDTTPGTTCDSVAGWVSTGTSRSVTPSGMLRGTTYYWQVRAVNAFGSTDANSGTWWSFATTPGNFQKLRPANASTNVSINPTLSWNTSSGATSYEYCIDTTAGSTCDSPAGWVSTGTTLNVALSGLSPSTTYYWQVRSVLAGGNTFANNAWWSFTTAP